MTMGYEMRIRPRATSAALMGEGQAPNAAAGSALSPAVVRSFSPVSVVPSGVSVESSAVFVAPAAGTVALSVMGLLFTTGTPRLAQIPDTSHTAARSSEDDHDRRDEDPPAGTLRGPPAACCLYPRRHGAL